VALTTHSIYRRGEERLQLYLFSPSRLSWSVLGYNLLLTLRLSKHALIVRFYFVLKKNSNNPVLTFCSVVLISLALIIKVSNPITGLDRPLGLQQVEAPQISSQSVHKVVRL
jgi:hypothetical protein